MDLDDVREAIRIATGGLDADLCVVLDLPAREGTARQQRDGMQPDRIEQAGDAFLSRVREGYLELAESEVTVRTVSARGKPEEVHMRIRELLARTFPETFGEDVV